MAKMMAVFLMRGGLGCDVDTTRGHLAARRTLAPHVGVAAGPCTS